MLMLRKILLLGLSVCLAANVFAAAEADEEDENKPWQELEAQFPAPPQAENLQSFHVSATTDNKFFIDMASLSVGDDGVVRYTLLVITPEGGRNVTFEGMRCQTRERRIYASGRADGSWVKSRNNQWMRLQPASVNRHHAALFLEYFCPTGGVLRDVEAVRRALKQGGYAETWGR